jgi:poly-gamma-glutamate synthesis protein (capsule biosynthesis protein)
MVAGVAVGGAAGLAVNSAGGTAAPTNTTTRPASNTAPPETTAPPASTMATTATTLAAAQTDPALGSGQPVTIAFGGDTTFDGSNAGLVGSDPGRILAGVAPALAGADLAVVNMETAIGVGGTRAPKQFTFQAPPAALGAYRAAGVDVVSAANNHGMDYGVASLHETLDAERDLGFPVIGIGANEAEAYAPFVAEVRGQRIAIIAATQVIDGHLVDDWTATLTTPGLASAKRTDRLLQAVARPERTPTPSSSSCTGASSVTRARARVSRRWPASWWRPGPTSSSAVTPIGSRAAAGSAMPSSTMASATWRLAPAPARALARACSSSP